MGSPKSTCAVCTSPAPVSSDGLALACVGCAERLCGTCFLARGCGHSKAWFRVHPVEIPDLRASLTFPVACGHCGKVDRVQVFHAAPKMSSSETFRVAYPTRWRTLWGRWKEPCRYACSRACEDALKRESPTGLDVEGAEEGEP